MIRILNRITQIIIISVLILFSLSCTQKETHPNTNTPRKVLIFGIDAAAWNAIDPLCESGYLPTFQKLIRTGTRKHLQTLSPTVSVMLWTTIATGMLPENHGIVSWLAEGSDTSGQLAITSNIRRVPAIWNLGKHHRFLFSNWWATWPVENINGVMISNRAHFDRLNHTIHPPEYRHSLETVKKQTRESLESELTMLNPFDNDISLSRFTFNQLQKDRFYLDAAAKILALESFHVVGLFVRGVDILEHEFLSDVLPDANIPDVPDDKRGIVISYYKYLDKQLERFIGLMGASTTIIVVSDHGMDPVTELPPMIEGLKLDFLLGELGIISKDQTGKLLLHSALFRNNKHYPPGLKLGLSWNGSTDVSKNEIQNKAEKVREKLKNIKMGSTLLFREIKINQELSEVLTLFLNPEPSSKVNISIQEEEYPLLSMVNLIIHPKSGQHWHAPPGIFLVSGPGIQHSEAVGTIQIQDIAPTVAYLAGLHIAKDLDGQPQTDFVSSEFIKSNPMKWVNTYGSRKLTTPLPTDSSVDRIIENELQQLGYIQ